MLCMKISIIRAFGWCSLKEHHIDTETYKKALSGSIAMTGTNVDFILKGINEYLMALAKEQIKLAFEQSEKKLPICTSAPVRAF